MRNIITVEIMRQALIACRPCNCPEEEIRNRLAEMSDEKLKQTDICCEFKFKYLDLLQLTMYLESQSNHYSPHDEEIIYASGISVAKIMSFYND